MLPVRIAGANRFLGPPQNWNDEQRGKCSHLAVRVEDGCSQSAWEPTPQELEMLNAGGHVVLTVVGGQPVVALGVEMPESGG